MASINASVGKNGINRRPDVKTVQGLLNAHIGKLAPLRALTVDGIVGSATIRAIETFQSKVARMKRPDGRVDPGGRTMTKLNLAVGGSCWFEYHGKASPGEGQESIERDSATRRPDQSEGYQRTEKSCGTGPCYV